MNGASRRARRRVLFFDAWTRGLHNMTRLADAAPPDRAEFLLLHLGSLIERGVPPVEDRDRLLCLDASAFGRRPIDEMIRLLRPDVVVGFTMTSLFDRIMYVTCRRLNIPTVFVQHGAWADPDNLAQMVRQQDAGITVLNRLMRIPKFLWVFPAYLRASRRSLLQGRTWQLVARLVRSPVKAHFYPIEAQELWPDLALNFTNDAARLLQDTHGISAERTRVVGNPELDHAAARRKQPLTPVQRAGVIREVGLEPGRPVVTFIEEAFVEQQGWFGWTEARRIRVVEELHAACRQVGAQLLVRPHPASAAEGMRGAVAASDAVVSRALSVLDNVDVADVVVGALSTVLETAVLLEKPILVPIWYLNGDRRISPFVRYDAATVIERPEDLAPTIARALAPDWVRPDTATYIERRLGSVDGQATARMVEAILALADRPRRSA